MHGLYLLWWVGERGISPAIVAAILAAGDLALVALELPAGWFADRFGHRASLIVGSSVQVAGAGRSRTDRCGCAGRIRGRVSVGGRRSAPLSNVCRPSSRGGFPEDRGADESRGYHRPRRAVDRRRLHRVSPGFHCSVGRRDPAVRPWSGLRLRDGRTTGRCAYRPHRGKPEAVPASPFPSIGAVVGQSCDADPACGLA